MKKVQKIFHKRTYPRKSSTHQNIKSRNDMNILNNEVKKLKVLQRYRHAWYTEINNRQESSESSSSDIDDGTGYVSMKSRTKSQHIRQNSMNYNNSIQYSKGGGLNENENILEAQNFQHISPERGNSVESKSYFMRVTFDYFAYDVTDLSVEVTIYEGDIVRTIEPSDEKNCLIENIEGNRVNIPKCYLCEISKEELLEIINEEYATDTTIDISGDESCRGFSDYSDIYTSLETISDKRDSRKKSIKNVEEHVIEDEFSYLPKYTPLTENIRNEVILEHENDEKRLEYKINPNVAQRKIKPKKPFLFDHTYKTWVDSDISPPQTPNEIQNEKTSDKYFNGCQGCCACKETSAENLHFDNKMNRPVILYTTSEKPNNRMIGEVSSLLFLQFTEQHSCSAPLVTSSPIPSKRKPEVTDYIVENRRCENTNRIKQNVNIDFVEGSTHHNISPENEDLMTELSNQQELLMKQIEELNNFTFD